jgi:hypothetical protein
MHKDSFKMLLTVVWNGVTILVTSQGITIQLLTVEKTFRQ